MHYAMAATTPVAVMPPSLHFKTIAEDVVVRAHAHAECARYITVVVALRAGYGIATRGEISDDRPEAGIVGILATSVVNPVTAPSTMCSVSASARKPLRPVNGSLVYWLPTIAVAIRRHVVLCRSCPWPPWKS